MRPSFTVSIAIATAFGVAVSSGFVAGLAFAALFPVIVVLQENRVWAYGVAASYYVGAGWSMVPICRNYFESGVGVPVGVSFWVIASGLLALPWLWAWHARRRATLWRAPLAIVLSILPPLGIIGWANPVVSAGILLPGTRWWGVLVTLVLPGVLVNWPRGSIAALVAAVIVTNLHCVAIPAAPADWESVNTHYGNLAGSFLAEYSAAVSLCEYMRGSKARVLVLPESSVPRWSAASARFWRECLAGDSDRTVVLGAQIPTPHAFDADFSAVEFDSALQTLHGNYASAQSRRQSGERYRNVLVAISSRDTVVLDQHIPVPIAMWMPFATGGVSIEWRPNAPVLIAGRRVGVLICYEVLLPWPVLSAIVSTPDVLLLIANNNWSGGSSVPVTQIAFLKSWSRLFRTPFLRAANFQISDASGLETLERCVQFGFSEQRERLGPCGPASKSGRRFFSSRQSLAACPDSITRVHVTAPAEPCRVTTPTGTTEAS